MSSPLRWTMVAPPVERSRQGAMLPLIALLLPVLILFVGFSIDLAYMQNTRMELRVATDVASRAAAGVLSETNDQNLARRAGKNFARLNTVAGAPLLLSDEDFEFGYSTPNEAGRWIFEPNGEPVNSVRVHGRRTASSASGAVPLFFGAFFNQPTFEPSATATGSFAIVDICLVLDRSSSMKLDVADTGATPDYCQPPTSSSRWMALDGAVRMFLDRMEESPGREKIAQVSYSSTTSGGCGSQSEAATLDVELTDMYDAIFSSLDNLSSSVTNGNTNIEAGVRLGVEALIGSNSSYAGSSFDSLFDDFFSGSLLDGGSFDFGLPGDSSSGEASRLWNQRVMIVLTDGNENVGDVMAAVPSCVENGIVVHTITFSSDANQTLMSQLASATRGVHLHADNTDQLRAAFQQLAAIASQLTE